MNANQYAAGPTAPEATGRTGWRARSALRKLTRVGKWSAIITAAVVVALAVPVAVAAPSINVARSRLYTEPPGQMPSEPSDAIARHDPAKPTAVVVLGNEGTNAADSLPHFEVLAASGAFNVYTVAEERRLVPLVGGLDLVPDLSYDDLGQLLDAPPEVIVVPQIENEPRPGSPVISWLDEQRRAGTPLIVSVCVGAGILAEAGYLDDRPATSHWLGLIGLRRSELASVFRGYTENNFLAKPLSFTADGQPIQSRHGLTFVPRADADEAAARVDRIVVPGAQTAQRRDAALPQAADDLPVTYPHAEPGFAFNGILVDVADHYDAASARWLAKTLQFPTHHLDLSGSAWPWGLTLRFSLLAAAGVALALGAARLLGPRRRRPTQHS